jgi:16S rRNA (cytidine1402-2'-O)-methyltransferase
MIMQVSEGEAKVSIEVGLLYVVATPLGNLADITYRAVEVLGQVNLIAAEDTRHSRALLNTYGITTPMHSLHEHNERVRVEGLIERLRRGESIALISDAGTPLISDPGQRLVAAARAAGVRVSPIPGPSALIAALSAAGLPTDRFVFEGFLPAKAAARARRLKELAHEPRTLILFEASHRIVASLNDMSRCFGPARRAVVARELTKLFETLHSDSLQALCAWIEADANRRRGEFVVLIEGAPTCAQGASTESRRLLSAMLAELPVKTAARITAEVTGENKNKLYRLALDIGAQAPREINAKRARR